MSSHPPPPARPATWLARLLDALAGVQLRAPWLVIALVAATLVPSIWLARSLELRSSLSELLPDDKPSVLELQRVKDRLEGMSTLVLVAEAEDPALLREFVDAVAPRLRGLPREWVSGVDDGPREAQAFFDLHKHLYAELSEIEKLHEDVTARYDWEVGRKAGTNLDDDEEPPRIDAATVEQRFARKVTDTKETEPGAGGYYLGEGGRLAAVVVRTPLASADLRAFELKERVSRIVGDLGFEKRDPSFRHSFTGSLITSAEQYRAVKEDLQNIGGAGVLMILGVVFLFFLRVRVLLALGTTIGVGCTWAFAVAELAIGHLNTATGFLVSIIAGNGMNFSIIYMARYLEARRVERETVEGALRAATRDTHAPTLAVSGVAMVSYGALMTTDFRGFRHFGVIGGAGMFLCWVATFVLLPALLVVSERLRPLPEVPTLRDRLSGLYGKPFAWLSRRFAAPIAAVGVGSAVATCALTIRYFAGDPMEYDLRNIQNEQKVTAAGELAVRVNRVVGRMSQSGRAVLTDRLDQVEPLVAELERRRDSAPEGLKPFGKVVSIYSLIPKEQDEKIELLEELVDQIERARARGFVSDEEWKKLEPHLPKSLDPIGIDDLPPLAAQPFVERDGSRGRIVYVAPTPGKSLSDARYLMQWADAFREVRMPNGDVIRGTGDAVVYSDMLLNIGEDAPRVALTSFLGTVLVILLAFRFRRSGFAALATLALGVMWMVAALALLDVKMNFLNFVALPISIGVGADYGINIMARREIEGDAALERVFVETGGAVIACSLVTLLGYLALLFSVNGAVRSFGQAAAIGEASTQLTAMLVLPAVLYSVGRWQRRRARP